MGEFVKRILVRKLALVSEAMYSDAEISDGLI